jgi:hypothetical protein
MDGYGFTTKKRPKASDGRAKLVLRVGNPRDGATKGVLYILGPNEVVFCRVTRFCFPAERTSTCFFDGAMEISDSKCQQKKITNFCTSP